MADLLFMGKWRAGTVECRDCGLSLGGSHGVNGDSSGRAPGRGTEGARNERRGIGAKDFRAYQPGNTNPERHTQRYRRLGLAVGPFLWDKPAVLVESADPVRCADCGTESGKSDSQPSKAEAQRACLFLMPILATHVGNRLQRAVGHREKRLSRRRR